MSAREFRDDDSGYLAWIAAHPGGCVINIRRGHNRSDARLHLATCGWISGDNPRGGPWTGTYVKVCGEEIGELEQWATEHAGGTIRRCGTCHPSRDPAGPRKQSPAAARPTPAAESASRLARKAEVRGPAAGRHVVEAWAVGYVHFQNRSAWQEELRDGIRSRVDQLMTTPEKVLHATFFGQLPPRTDVENLLLYNFGSFASATRFGVRFEVTADVPPAPGGRSYPYGYRFELAPRGGGYSSWRDGRNLASFGWIDLRELSGDKICEQTWLALASAEIAVADPPREPATPFSVRLTIRPRLGATRSIGGLVKGIFDGTISAFQAQTDASELTELAIRAAKHIPATPAEIESLLVAQDKAVLGAVRSLIHRRGLGVQWSPADDLCVAGELLAEQPSGSSWAIKGEIVEVEPISA